MAGGQCFLQVKFNMVRSWLVIKMMHKCLLYIVLRIWAHTLGKKIYLYIYILYTGYRDYAVCVLSKYKIDQNVTIHSKFGRGNVTKFIYKDLNAL